VHLLRSLPPRHADTVSPRTRSFACARCASSPVTHVHRQPNRDRFRTSAHEFWLPSDIVRVFFFCCFGFPNRTATPPGGVISFENVLPALPPHPLSSIVTIVHSPPADSQPAYPSDTRLGCAFRVDLTAKTGRAEEVETFANVPQSENKNQPHVVVVKTIYSLKIGLARVCYTISYPSACVCGPGEKIKTTTPTTTSNRNYDYVTNKHVF